MVGQGWGTQSWSGLGGRSGAVARGELPCVKMIASLTVFHLRFILGTTAPQTVHVRTSCCHPGFSMKAKDLAGNSVLCEVGEVLNTSTRLDVGILGMFILVLISLVLTDRAEYDTVCYV